MANVDLVYAPDCPNVELARANLLRAFAQTGIEASWSEHRIGDPAVPVHVRGYGSPSILVDGRDIAGFEPSAEACCRIYVGPERHSEAPDVEIIARALSLAAKRDAPPVSVGGWRSSLGVVPGIGIAFLPKVACPACWPAYAGVLTSLGLGFLLESAWLLPVTAVFLVIAVVALGFRARRRGGFGPFWLGLAAGATVLLGKFGFENNLAMYTGLGVLVAASIWNSWPRHAAPACPACTTSSHTLKARSAS